MAESSKKVQAGERAEQEKLHQAQVVILDAGSQFCGQIDRAVRESGVRSDILPLDSSLEVLEQYSAVIISGGPDSVTAEDSVHCDPAIFHSGKPVLGICYGLQLMAHHLGGQIGDAGIREDGKTSTWLMKESVLFAGVKASEKGHQVWMSHGDSVLTVPTGFRVVGGHEEIIAAIEHQERGLYGVQFHPEVDGTDDGIQMIQNFLFKIASLERDFEPQNLINHAKAEIREVAGVRNVVMLLSGGVDSTVLADLVAETIAPDKIKAIHVDNGFMRADESEEVKAALEEQGIELEVVDAMEMFLTATTIIDGEETEPLHRVTDPQIKRRIIGDTFVRLTEQLIESYGLNDDTVLAQGTLRPDIIESGSHLAGTGLATIKFHHNDTPAVRALREQGRVLEPLKGFYKDQVREIGRMLGLSDDFVMRQPFPGPGLAIRVICTSGETNLIAHDQHQTDLNNFLTKYPKIVGDVMPFQTVGVQGDGRSYKSLAVLRTDDAPNWHQLIEIASQIPREVTGVNRVAYAFKNASPAENATPTFLEAETLDQLRLADAIVRTQLTKAGLDHQLSQVPVILAPISFGEEGGRSIALRPFSTRDFMTGRPAVPSEDIAEEVLQEIVNTLLSEVPGITQVLYDLSSKPPATTEWE